MFNETQKALFAIIISIASVAILVALIPEMNMAQWFNKSIEQQTSKQLDKTAQKKQQKTKHSNRFHKSKCQAILDTHSSKGWIIGPNKNMSWYESKNWAVKNKQCGVTWRLPTVKELEALFDHTKKAGTGYCTKTCFTAKMDPIFGKIGDGSWVWSSDEKNKTTAFFFNFYTGKPVFTDKSGKIPNKTELFAVRAFAITNEFDKLDH